MSTSECTVNVQCYENGIAVFVVRAGHVTRETYIECPEMPVALEWAESRAAELRRRMRAGEENDEGNEEGTFGEIGPITLTQSALDDRTNLREKR